MACVHRPAADTSDANNEFEGEEVGGGYDYGGDPDVTGTEEGGDDDACGPSFASSWNESWTCKAINTS